MKILIKGAGDLATGIAVRLFQCGHQIVMTEIEKPLTVRRMVAFSRAVYEEKAEVEGICGKHVYTLEEAEQAVSDGQIAVLVDPQAEIRKSYQPDVMIDAILAKKNLGTRMSDAPFVVGVGPGFTAGNDCHCVIETKRGHTLGSVIWKGSAIPNTGVPGNVGGYTVERLIRASAKGEMEAIVHIGDLVQEGQVVAYTGGKPVYAKMSGIVRGMLQDNVIVEENLKIGDIDARCERFHCFTVSDKARSIGGAALEAVTQFERIYQKFAVVVLAAGAGKRYGSNKLLANIQGRPLYEHMIEKLNALRAFPAYLVTGYEEIKTKAESAGVSAVDNQQPELGISYSLKLGLQACLKQHMEIQGVLFSVCDQPNLTLSTMLTLMRTAMLHPGRIVCSAHEGKPGNPVLWDRKFFGELLELEGDTGGRQILERRREQCILVEADAEELKDIDRKQDLAD
ncbi:selenium-dependent molybdenum cofactor biosynthesis protein YqeB [Mediterraneibacter agrestimuris]|uniref:selenium-dependent molybdenum cofactor biosynthesis protein YqeB n=1 Tax=Mediterraneibacter agrestimuris TaxID=2941333 RepID=UPI00203C21B3|nr:selenium-dependent molybdenum cofactor biosynthesis protein YqeB [Mediterraneibacter agrestimuris]